MKNYHILFIPIASAILICFAFIGCETESTDSNVTISPDSVTIQRGKSIEFTASGGTEYTWSLEKDEITYGHLSTRTGNKTVYTSIASPASSAIVRVLTVRSTIEETNGTNSIPEGWTAQAYITHQ